MITYRASLDVPVATLTQVTAWLSAHRRTHDSPTVKAGRTCVWTAP